MSLALDEKTLEIVAADGDMDYDKWPAIIEPLLERLNQIAYTEFPTPRPYPTIARSPLQSSPPQAPPTAPRDLTSTIQTPSTPVRQLPPVPPFPNSSATSTSHIPDSLPPSQDPPTDTLNELPTLLLQLLDSVTQTLRSAFSERPPHTIQRLSELILNPTKHYKTLPAWLRAIDRVVSVSSPADIFPLSDTPPLVNGVNGEGGGGILWNNNEARNGYDSNSLGSDESLGGALLTPIPWLRNGMAGADVSSEDSTQLDSNTSASSDGLDDALGLPISQNESDPLVTDRPDGAVTQGELIRMEQEAGVVPVAHNVQDATLKALTGDDDGLYVDDVDLVPHARGPELVGSVDMGRVGGQDVQIHIGSPPGDGNSINPSEAQLVDAGPVASSAASNTTEPGSIADSEDFEIVLKDAAGDGALDAMQVDEGEETNKKPSGPSEELDGDIVLVDADGKSEIETESTEDRSGQNIDASAPDSSTMT